MDYWKIKRTFSPDFSLESRSKNLSAESEIDKALLQIDDFSYFYLIPNVENSLEFMYQFHTEHRV